jgi:ribosomal protein S17E
VKGTNVKTLAHALVAKYPQLFTKEYAHNKAKVKELGLMAHSKIELHKLAGELGNETRKRLAGPRKRRFTPPGEEREGRRERWGARGRDRDRERE